MLVFYLVLVIIRPHEWVADAPESPIPRLFLLGGFAFWLFMKDKNLRVPQSYLAMALIIWIVMSMVSMVYLAGVIESLERMIPLLLFFYPLSAACQSRKSLITVIVTLSIGALVLALHSVIQANVGYGWTGQSLVQGRVRYIGIFGDPNDLGMLFVFAIPLAAYLIKNTNIFGSKLIWLATVGLCIYGIVLTDSRGSLLALLGIIGLILINKYGKVAAGIVGVLALPAMFAATRLSQIDTDESSAAGRLDAWYAGLQMFESDPIFGAGFSLFTDHHGLTAHNSWILAIGELGLPGYLVWFALVGVSMHLMYIVYRGSSRFVLAAQTVRTSEPASEVDIPAADKQLAGAILLASMGAMAAAFFLSRTYEILMFIMWGMSAGHYTGTVMRSQNFDCDLRALVKFWFKLGLVSVVFFYVLVRVSLVVL